MNYTVSSHIGLLVHVTERGKLRLLFLLSLLLQHCFCLAYLFHFRATNMVASLSPRTQKEIGARLWLCGCPQTAPLKNHGFDVAPAPLVQGAWDINCDCGRSSGCHLHGARPADQPMEDSLLPHRWPERCLPLLSFCRPLLCAVDSLEP